MRHGSQIDPPNRFEKYHREVSLEQLTWDDEYHHDVNSRKVEYLSDESQSIVSENKSPDVPFRFSLNPYRGCVHGCAYCYARPTHEYLGFNAGLDFETRIVVKHSAAQLFREFLSKASWKVEPVTFSGVTDCYQPAEREFRLTRSCIEVAESCKQPISVITKNALVLRDLDLLQSLARDRLVHVFVSITTLDKELARLMEPRTSTPEARIRAVKTLADAGVPTGVMVAPVIPGLNDSEIPSILKAAKAAGAQSAGYVLLRMPQTVKPVFIEWIQRTQPLKSQMVIDRLRDMRDGELNSAEFGARMTGVGPMADQVRALFMTFRKNLDMDKKLPPYNRDLFKPPASGQGQQMLF